MILYARRQLPIAEMSQQRVACISGVSLYSSEKQQGRARTCWVSVLSVKV